MYVCMYRGNLNVRTLFGILSSHNIVRREQRGDLIPARFFFWREKLLYEEPSLACNLNHIP